MLLTIWRKLDSLNLQQDHLPTLECAQPGPHPCPQHWPPGHNLHAALSSAKADSSSSWEGRGGGNGDLPGDSQKPGQMPLWPLGPIDLGQCLPKHPIQCSGTGWGCLRCPSTMLQTLHPDTWQSPVTTPQVSLASYILHRKLRSSLEVDIQCLAGVVVFLTYVLFPPVTASAL